MYDHVGGGFARYSTDAHWLVPHFEKMLYDNALLARLYTHAWQATGDNAHRAVAEDVLAWVTREMTSPEGGFYSALDADSEGEEGKFYVWTPGEIDSITGAEDGALVRAYYGVTEAGNFEGHNILHAWRSMDEVAAEQGVSPERLREVLDRARPRLYAERAKRVWPGRDDKVLTSWNAMMLHAFAEAARAFESHEYRRIAVASAEFLVGRLRTEDGRLARTYKDGRAKIPGFLEDHALLGEALVAVYETTWDERWLREARTLADQVLQSFWDDEQGIFFDTAADAEQLVIRPRDLFDNATPSGNSAAVNALLRLAELVGDERYSRVARRVLESLADTMARVPAGFGHLLSALDFHLATPTEVAFVGTPGEAESDALLRVVGRAYLPNTVTVLRRARESGDEELIPLLRGRTAREGRATAYVCERFACQQPVTDPAALAAQLGLATP
jgi:uncharacterized protein YyaL (SSP411 family)